MASQLRVNKSENRSGLGTITYTDTGAIVSGIVTANSFSGDIIGNITGAVTGTTGSFSGDVSIAEKIIHTGDTNTFMKFDTDIVTFETAGDERIRITSDGKIGIGDIANPGGLLTVYDGAAANDTPEILLSAFRPAIRFQDRSSSALDSEIVGDLDSLIFRISAIADNDTALTEQMRLKSVSGSGYLGIGTHNPDQKLEVFNGAIKIDRRDNADPTNPHFEMRTGATGGSRLMIYAEDHTNDNSDWIYKTNANEDHIFHCGSTQRFRITGTGQLVSNNTTSVDCAAGGLHLHLSAGARNDYSTSADGLIIEKSGSTGLSIDPGSSGQANIYFPNEANHSIAQISHNNSNGEFRVRGEDHIILSTNSNTPRLYIDNGGRIITGNDTQVLDSTPGTLHISGGGTNGSRMAFRGTNTGANTGIGEIFAYWDTNKVAGVIATSGTNTGGKSDGNLLFYTASGSGVAERMRITRDGDVEIANQAYNTQATAATSVNTIVEANENRSGVYWLNFNGRVFRAYIKANWIQDRNWVLAAKYFDFQDMPSGSSLWTNDTFINESDFNLWGGLFSKYPAWRYFSFNRLAMQMGNRMPPIMGFDSNQTLYGAFSGGRANNGGGVTADSTWPTLSGTDVRYHNMNNFMGPDFYDVGGSEDRMQSYGLNKWANNSTQSTAGQNRGSEDAFAGHRISPGGSQSADHSLQSESLKGWGLTVEDHHPQINGVDSIAVAGAWIGCPLDEGDSKQGNDTSNGGSDSGFGMGWCTGNPGRTGTAGYAEWGNGSQSINTLPAYIWLSID